MTEVVELPPQTKMVPTGMFETDMPNVNLNEKGFIYVCGENIGLGFDDLKRKFLGIFTRSISKEQIVAWRNSCSPGSNTWQFLQCYLDRGRRLKKGAEIFIEVPVEPDVAPTTEQ